MERKTIKCDTMVAKKEVEERALAEEWRKVEEKRNKEAENLLSRLQPKLGLSDQEFDEVMVRYCESRRRRENG